MPHRNENDELKSNSNGNKRDHKSVPVTNWDEDAFNVEVSFIDLTIQDWRFANYFLEKDSTINLN